MIKRYHITTFIKLLQSLKNPCRTLLNINTYNPVSLKNGTKFWLRNFMDLWVITESYILKDYEANGCKVGHGWNIIDIGAGIGDFSILAAQASYKNTVYAIEPFFKSFSLFKKNIKTNNLKNIKAFNIGLASNRGFIKILKNQTNLANNISTFSQKINNKSIKAVKLPDFIEENKISKIDLLKSDCEGAEFDIFLNLPAQSYKKIDKIIMEYHLFNDKNKLNSLIKVFKQNKYKIRVTPNPVHQNIGFLYAHKN